MSFINKSFIFTEGTRIRGMLVPQRSEQSYILPNATKANFISVVKAKEPLGLNPIMKSFSVERKKKDNGVYNRNRKMIVKIKDKTKERLLHKDFIKNTFGTIIKKNKTQSLKSLKPIKLKKSLENGLLLNLNHKQYDSNINSNDLVYNSDEDIKKETKNNNQSIAQEGVDDNGNKKEEITNDTKDIIEETKEEAKDNILNEEDMNEEEMNKILEYINSLDYDKYVRDLEIREAFQLIKNKMLKEKIDEEKAFNEENKKIDEEQNSGNINEENSNDNSKSNGNDKDIKTNKEILPEIKHTSPTNKEEEKKNKEKQQFKIVNQISKSIPVTILIIIYRN